MKTFIKIIVVICCIFLSLPVSASEKWVSTMNSTPPIVFLDTDSIKRFNNGAVYNVRYINKNNSEILAQIYTDLSENAAVLSANEYNKSNKYNVYKIPNNLKMKPITSDSSIYNSLLEVKKIVSTDKVKYCAPDKCLYIGGRPGIDALKDPDFGPYMRDLQRRIKMNWEPPKGSESKRVVLLFKIAKDGRLLSCSVFKSSGSSNIDSSAIKAVRTAAPFRPLPVEYNNESIDIQFTFDYNVFSANNY